MDARLTPPEFMHAWTATDRIADIVPLLAAAPGDGADAVAKAG